MTLKRSKDPLDIINPSPRQLDLQAAYLVLIRAYVRQHQSQLHTQESNHDPQTLRKRT